MGTEMIPVDTLFASQVEAQDYVRFTDINGVTHSGTVLDTEDQGDTFLITLSDDDDWDTNTHEVSADGKQIELMMYDAVAV